MSACRLSRCSSLPIGSRQFANCVATLGALCSFLSKGPACSSPWHTCWWSRHSPRPHLASSYHPLEAAQCSRQLPKCTKCVCGRCVSGAGEPENTHKVHPGLPFPCHHVCPWCASPWATVGSLKPHLEWSGHRNSNCGEMFARDWCVTVVTDLPDVETEQNKGCVTHKTYDPSPGNTPFSLPSSP